MIQPCTESIKIPRKIIQCVQDNRDIPDPNTVRDLPCFSCANKYDFKFEGIKRLKHTLNFRSPVNVERQPLLTCHHRHQGFKISNRKGKRLKTIALVCFPVLIKQRCLI